MVKRLSAQDDSSTATTNVNITSGSVTGITDLAIADGGTGASTAAAARTNLGTNQAVGFVVMTVGTTAPSSPSVGDVWVDTN